jgi:hypothetical protein
MTGGWWLVVGGWWLVDTRLECLREMSRMG